MNHYHYNENKDITHLTCLIHSYQSTQHKDKINQLIDYNHQYANVTNMTQPNKDFDQYEAIHYNKRSSNASG